MGDILDIGDLEESDRSLFSGTQNTVEEKDGASVSRAEVWIRGHSDKNGKPHNAEIAEIVDKINACNQSQCSESTAQSINNDPISQVFGTEHQGRVRGLGFGVTPTGVGSTRGRRAHLYMSDDGKSVGEQIWIKVNVEQTSFYRVKYDDVLATQLKDRHYHSRMRKNNGKMRGNPQRGVLLPPLLKASIGAKSRKISSWAASEVAGAELIFSYKADPFGFAVKRRSNGDVLFNSSTEMGSPIWESGNFTLQCLEIATRKYDTLIGEGGFGSVYCGTLPDGQEVAVKVGSATSTQGTREFENELNLLSAIQHENLVPLFGYCCENDQQILVYPFMSNGSLQDRLYGLFYLHTFAGRGVIHRDVKSSNILLDHSMCAKVANFSFSKYAPQEGDSGVSLECLHRPADTMNGVVVPGHDRLGVPPLPSSLVMKTGVHDGNREITGDALESRSCHTGRDSLEPASSFRTLGGLCPSDAGQVLRHCPERASVLFPYAVM
ncbi:hypothetical protein Sjap_024865 [Stephania japonica]|uniref:Protein kinase domain-containing protein n=1 Tax=Stephania japonica TaxID=461633 RepID=A0AAP0ELE4_9MAGN